MGKYISGSRSQETNACSDGEARWQQRTGGVGKCPSTGSFYEGKDHFHSVYIGVVYLGINEDDVPVLS